MAAPSHISASQLAAIGTITSSIAATTGSSITSNISLQHHDGTSSEMVSMQHRGGVTSQPPASIMIASATRPSTASASVTSSSEILTDNKVSLTSSSSSSSSSSALPTTTSTTATDASSASSVSSASVSSLLWSIGSGEERLDYMLTNGISLTECSVKGMSPLQFACSMFDEELALRILNEGIDVDWYEIGRDGYTALHLACEAGLNDVVTWLLTRAKLADHTIAVSTPVTAPTILATSSSAVAPTSTSSPLAASTRSRSYMSVKEWLRCGTCDIRITSSTFQSGGRTPLHIAAHRGEEDLIKLLLGASADPFITDWDNNTPLYMAAAANRAPIVKLLHTIMMTTPPSISDTKTTSSATSSVASLSLPSVSSLLWQFPWGNNDDMPSREWIAVKQRNDQILARWRSDIIMDPQPPLTSYHILPAIWSVKECDSVWSAVMRSVAIRGWSDNRHRAYNTTDIPACDVPEIESFVKQSIRSRVFPILLHRYFGRPLPSDGIHDTHCNTGGTGHGIHDTHRTMSESKVTTTGATGATGATGITDISTPLLSAMPSSSTIHHSSDTAMSSTFDGSSGGSDSLSRIQLGFRDLFFVKYEHNDIPGASQSSLDVHRDGSLLSFNILINPSTDFDGGGTYFEAAHTTITIQQGDLLAHSGQLLHGGHTITRGKRFILVGFIDVIGYHPGFIAQQQQQKHAVTQPITY